LCTDPAREPLQIVRWFIQRWQVEVTFREVRDYLGVETPRQWSDRAIARTTPCLLGLFSLVTLLVTRLGRHARLAVPAESLYHKPVLPSATPWTSCAERFAAKAVSSCPSARMKRCNCRPLSSSA
jgi:hypothetical protein